METTSGPPESTPGGGRGSGVKNLTALWERQQSATRRPYLALDPSLAAATVARIAVQTTVAAALLPRQADGAQLSFLPGVYAGDAGSPQERSPPLGWQRLQEEAIIHLHGVHIQVFVRHVLQGQEVGLSARHCSVAGQLWGGGAKEGRRVHKSHE